MVLLQVCGGDGAQLADILTQLEGQVPAEIATRDPDLPDPQADLVSFVSFTLDDVQAYVIAHEVGHHVQHLLGVSERVRTEQQARPAEANELSVRLELQADCFAGVWAAGASAEDLLERGDLDEALRAAEAIGDDAIQAQAGRPVNPETWTHGSSDQRRRWFLVGFESGDPNRCDTFAQ